MDDVRLLKIRAVLRATERHGKRGAAYYVLNRMIGEMIEGVVATEYEAKQIRATFEQVCLLSERFGFRIPDRRLRALADGLSEAESRVTIRSAFGKTAREPLRGKPQGSAAGPGARRVTAPPCAR